MPAVEAAINRLADMHCPPYILIRFEEKCGHDYPVLAGKRGKRYQQARGKARKSALEISQKKRRGEEKEVFIVNAGKSIRDPEVSNNVHRGKHSALVRKTVQQPATTVGTLERSLEPIAGGKDVRNVSQSMRKITAWPASQETKT